MFVDIDTDVCSLDCPTAAMHYFRPPHSPNQMAELQLWCYVEGDHIYFDVSISSSQTISRLKDLIHGKKPNFFGSRDASDLILSKVRHIVISMRTSM